MQGTREPLTELIPKPNQSHSQAQAGKSPEDTHDHALEEKDSHDLADRGAECFYDPNLLPLLHGNRDKRVHDSKCRHDDDEKKEKGHDRSFEADGVEVLPV